MAKIIFYSVQTGNKGFVPCIKEQSIEDFEFWFAHDNHYEAMKNKGWNFINITNKHNHLNNPKRQRLFKFIPRLLFNNFDYTVYVDSKFYHHKKFYELCLKIIKEDKPEWMSCYHKEKRTFQEEINFAIEEKNMPEKDIQDMLPFLNSNKWVSYDNCWMIRKNTDKNHEIGHHWFNLTDKCFREVIRDQLTLPMCIDSSYVNTKYTINQLEEYSIIKHT